MTRDSRTVKEIVTNPPDDDDDDDELAEAQLTESPNHVPIPNLVADALRSAPDVLTAREVAQIPPHYSVAELVDKPIVVVWKVSQKAYLPGDNGAPSTQRDGYFVTGAFTETSQTFTTWIGQSALKRDLESLALPFRTVIRKVGRKYNFR